MRKQLKRKRKHLIASTLVSGALACALVMTGCGGNVGAKLSEAASSDTVQAMVTAVDGDTLTVQLMDGQGPGGQGGQGQPEASTGDSGSDESAGNTDGATNTDGSTSTDAENNQGSSSGSQQTQPPAQPDGDSGSAPQGQPPAKPDGDGGSAPQGQPPAAPNGDSTSNSSGSSNAPQGQPPAAPNSGSADGSSDNNNSNSGDSNNNSTSQDQPPVAPDGDSTSNSDSTSAPQGQPSGMPQGTEATLTITDESIIYTSNNGEETQGSLEDITAGSMITLSANGTDVTKIVIGGAGGPGGSGGPGQGSAEANHGTAATEFASDTEESGKTYGSSTSDESAVAANNSATVSLKDVTVTKSGDSSSAEDSDFYGLNAGVLAYDGAQLTLDGGTVTTDSAGSNGVFAYGEGTKATVSNLTIKTSKGNSGGIEVSGGAELTANDLDIDTQGTSCAAIRSDRGGGTETVNGGTYVTHGTNSPAVYSTADVTVNDATLSAENTEGVVIEGKNSVTLNNCKVTGNVKGNATRSGVTNNVMIYQSMSGDASEGTGTFTMKGGSFTATHGTLFYVTNTDAVINLEDVDINNSGESLMTVAGNEGTWGQDGKNGATLTCTTVKQELSGDITVDDISTLKLSLTENSSYEGSVNSSGQAGTVELTLDASSSFKLTADTYVSSLSGDTSGIDLNGHTLYVDGKAWSK